MNKQSITPEQFRAVRRPEIHVCRRAADALGINVPANSLPRLGTKLSPISTAFAPPNRGFRREADRNSRTALRRLASPHKHRGK